MPTLISFVAHGGELESEMFQNHALSRLKITDKASVDKLSDVMLRKLECFNAASINESRDLLLLMEKAPFLRQLHIKYCWNLQDPVLVDAFERNLGDFDFLIEYQTHLCLLKV